MTDNKNALTEGPLTSSLVRFTVPFLFSNLLQTLYGTVDTLVVGNFGSTAGVSAVATGAQALSLVTFFTFGLSSGATVLLGKYYGAKENRNAASVVGNTIIDFSFLSLIFTVSMLFAYPWILRMLNIPQEAVGEANRYMLICSLGIPLIMGYNIVSAILRSVGNSKTPLLFVGIACIINIAGDLLLTGLFRMGALGVAIATVVSQGCSFLFSLFYIVRKGIGIPFSRNDIRFDRKMTSEIFKIGAPMGIQSVLINLSFLFITSIINNMGLTSSAAMGIGDKIVGFAFMPQHAFSASVSVTVSQNIGARKPKRALDAVKVSVLICVLVELVFLAICLIWPHFFPSIFSHDDEVIDLAGLYMMAYSIDAILTAVNFNLSGFMNGSGHTTMNLIQNLVSTFLGRIPATYILANLPSTNLFLVGMAAPCSSVMSAIMLFLMILYIRKKGIKGEIQ